MDGNDQFFTFLSGRQWRELWQTTMRRMYKKTGYGMKFGSVLY
jgi:hypothetical protein